MAEAAVLLPRNSLTLKEDSIVEAVVVVAVVEGCMLEPELAA
jgi:hypothetical protein